MAKHRTVKRVDRSLRRQTTLASVPRHPAPIALAASAVALQVALGVPLFIGGYTRSAYAATSCTYTPSGTIGPSTAIDCTVQSGTETQAQMLYGGARLFSTSGDTFNGLDMTVTNQATINLSGSPQGWEMAPFAIPGQNTVEKTGLGALYVGSRGSTNTPSDGGVGGGNGGALTVKNYGSIDAGNYGYGILVASVGGSGAPKTNGTEEPAGSGGAGGTINLGLYGTNSIAAGSRGGPAVYAASIGGNAGGSGNYGLGGAAGNVTISVSGTQTISTRAAAPGTGMIIPGVSAWPSGAGIKGVSQARASAFNANGPNSGSVSLIGTGTATINTSGNDSPGIYLFSEGGYGQNGGGGKGANCGGSCTGGAAGNVIVGTSGAYFNASVTTSGNASSALVAQSLGGAGATGLKRNGQPSQQDANGGAASGVSVYLDGAGIQTAGTSSHGIVAQSLGAGGGTYTTTATYVGDQNTTSAGGDFVNVHNRAAIAVSGDTSYGILAQSIGGAGGSVYASNSDGATIGGQSANVHGNAVTVVNAGNLTTGNQANGTGTGSIGILAQSIGGGGGGNGGNGGDSTALASAGVLQEKWENIKTKVGDGGDSSEKSFNFTLSVSHGGGGSGGDGGVATGLNKGVISTYGLFADASSFSPSAAAAMAAAAMPNPTAPVTASASRTHSAATAARAAPAVRRSAAMRAARPSRPAATTRAVSWCSPSAAAAVTAAPAIHP